MAIEFAERIRRIPVYPAAGGYALPEDVAHAGVQRVARPAAAAGRRGRGRGRARRRQPLPRPDERELRARARATATACRAARIAIGNGSCDILLAAGEALLEPGAELVYAWPSFSVYPHLAAASGARAIRVAARTTDARARPRRDARPRSPSRRGW